MGIFFLFTYGMFLKLALEFHFHVIFWIEIPMCLLTEGLFIRGYGMNKIPNEWQLWFIMLIKLELVNFQKNKDTKFSECHFKIWKLANKSLDKHDKPQLSLGEELIYPITLTHTYHICIPWWLFVSRLHSGKLATILLHYM